MIKVILFPFALICLIVLYASFREVPSIIPYPYDTRAVNVEGAKSAAESDILIIGDRMGRRLYPHLKRWAAKAATELKDPLSVFDWSGQGEGLHRTLAKVKALRAFPAVIIYHGATQEFLERRIHIDKDGATLLSNLKIWRNAYWASAFSLVPPLSELLYSGYHTVILEKNPRPDKSVYRAGQKQRQMQAVYELFTEEARELFALLAGKKTAILVVAPALELASPPKKVCGNATSGQIERRQEAVEQLLKQERNANAVSAALQLTRDGPGNARSFYLLGLAAKAAGKFKLAKAALYRAGAFDCDTSRGNIALNKILISEAEGAGVWTADLNAITNTDFGLQTPLSEKESYTRLLELIGPQVRLALGF